MRRADAQEGELLWPLRHLCGLVPDWAAGHGLHQVRRHICLARRAKVQRHHLTGNDWQALSSMRQVSNGQSAQRAMPLSWVCYACNQSRKPG